VTDDGYRGFDERHAGLSVKAADPLKGLPLFQGGVFVKRLWLFKA